MAIQENSDLCKKVCEEFQNLNYKKDIDPRTFKESYNILKQPDGEWFKTTKLSLHEAPTNSPLNLNEMPSLQKLISLIDELDSDIRRKGGRVFITEDLVYKIYRGTEEPIMATKKEGTGPYQKLCAEILEHGLERDRYRTEETYMLTKASNGEWSMSSSHENHSGTKKVLNLAKMPQLKSLAAKLNKLDSKFQLNGGRIFITPTRIYRLNNKIEVDFKV